MLPLLPIPFNSAAHPDNCATVTDIAVAFKNALLLCAFFFTDAPFSSLPWTSVSATTLQSSCAFSWSPFLPRTPPLLIANNLRTITGSRKAILNDTGAGWVVQYEYSQGVPSRVSQSVSLSEGLGQVLGAYVEYCNNARTHLSYRLGNLLGRQRRCPPYSISNDVVSDDPMVPSPQSDRARLRPDGHVPEVRRIAVAESSFLLLAVSPVRSRGQLHLERIPAVQIGLVIEEGFVSSSVIDSANIYPYCTYPVNSGK